MWLIYGWFTWSHEISLNLRNTIRRTSSWRFEAEATGPKEEDWFWDFWRFKFRSSMSSASMWFNCTQSSLTWILWRILKFPLCQKIVWLSMFFDLRTFWKTWHCLLYVYHTLNSLSLIPFQLFWTWVPFEIFSNGYRFMTCDLNHLDMGAGSRKEHLHFTMVVQ